MQHHNKKPRLTIVIPTVNRPQLVGRAIESALAQTRQDIEIIISDNGSRDETQEVIAKYHDARLKKFRHETTVSATDHGNFLVAQASGTFFLGLSDDDYIEPSFADRVIKHFEENPEIEFLYTGCNVHYGNICVPSIGGPSVESSNQFICEFFAGTREVCWCACVTRVEGLRSLGPIPGGRIFGDMFYWTQLAFKGHVGYVKDILSNYVFMSNNNLSTAVPAPLWGAESRLLADNVIASFIAHNNIQQKTPELKKLIADCKAFVARTTANHFIWTAIRGTSKIDLLHHLLQSVPLLKSTPGVWPRVVAALIMPRYQLQKVILKAAEKRAISRRKN